MLLLDANLVLRHLLDDHPELSPKAQDLLDRNDVELRYEVMCEIVYVLSKLYGVPRARIEADLRAFIAADSVYIQDEETACEALQLYRDQNIDIVPQESLPSETILHLQGGNRGLRSRDQRRHRDSLPGRASRMESETLRGGVQIGKDRKSNNAVGPLKAQT